MKIDFFNPEYVYGSFSTEKKERGIFFHRMTPELEDFYRYSEAAEIRAMNTSGVRICFLSDTSSLSISASFGRVSRNIYSFDIIAGNEMITLKPDQEKPETFSLAAALPGIGLRRIEIFLPNMAETFMESVEIDEGSKIMPVSRPERKWLFLGDSITQGMTVSSPSLSYAARTARALECDWQNIAVGGAVMRQEVGEMALALEWDNVSIAYGVNDFAQNIPIEQLVDNTKGLLHALTSRKDSEIFLITPVPWVGRTEPNTLGLHLEEYRKAIADTASSFSSVTVINGLEILPDDSKYFVDNIHPNDDGMKEYSAWLLEKVLTND